MSSKDYRINYPVLSGTFANSVIEKYFKRVAAVKKHSKTCAWIFSSFPSPLFYAYDIMPVYPQFNIYNDANYQQIAETLEGKWAVPQDLCSDVKAVYGYLFVPSLLPFPNPKPSFVMSHNMACIQGVGSYNIISQYIGVPHFYLNIPASHDGGLQPESLAYLVNQLTSISRSIEEQYQKRFNESIFRKGMERYLQIYVIWTEILNLCKNNPSPFDGQDMINFLVPFGCADLASDDMNVLQLYISLYNELYEQTLKNKEQNRKKLKHRIYWDGLPITNKKKYFKDVLARYRAATVMSFGAVFPLPYSTRPDLLFTYPLTAEQVETTYKHSDVLQGEFRLSEHENMSPMELLATVCLFLNGFKTTIGVRGEYIKRAIHDFDIDAVIMHMNQNCRTFSLIQTELMAYLRDELEIPVLIIQADIIDERSFSEAQITTRLEAFMENL